MFQYHFDDDLPESMPVVLLCDGVDGCCVLSRAYMEKHCANVDDIDEVRITVNLVLQHLDLIRPQRWLRRVV